MFSYNEKMKPVNVLHIFSGDLWAGAEVVIFNLLSELKKEENIRLYALCMNKGILVEKLKKEGIDVKIIDETENSFPFILIKAVSLFFSKNIDIIHCHRYKENLLGFLLKILIKPNARLITTVHGDIELSGIKEELKNKLNESILKRYFITVAVSKELKKRLVKRGFSEKRTLFIHNGIKIPEIRSTSRTSERIHIGTVGRLVPVKRYEIFIEIAYELKKRKKDFFFSILGDGPLKNKLLFKIKKLGLENDFKIFPHTPDPYSYLHSLDIYINTSAHEGLPISILEAMSCCIPVVAFKVGGIPEVIENGKNGFLLESFEEFIKVILNLSCNPELRLKIGKEARKKIEKDFRAEHMSKKYKELYMKLR